MDFPVPIKKPGVPEWLYKPLDEITDKSPDLTIAMDLVAVNFWAVVDQEVNAKVMREVKQTKGWDIRKPLEKQLPEIVKKHADYLAEVRAEFIRLIETDAYVRARLLATGADRAYDQSVELQSVLDQVQVRIALSIEESGLIPYIEGEFKSLTEWLLSKKRPLNSDGSVPRINYDMDWMAKYLIPILEANGYSRDLLLGVTQNFHKARFAISQLREIMADVIHASDEIREAMLLTDDELEKISLEERLYDAMQLNPAFAETLEALIKEIALTKKQGGLSVEDFRKELRKIKNREPAPDPALGYQYVMKKGAVLFVSIENKALLRAIINQTSSLIDWHLGEPEDLAKEAARILGVKEIIGDNNVSDSNAFSERFLKPDSMVAEAN